MLERPGLTRLREDIARGKLRYLICRDPDRLARNLAHQLIIAEECEKNGTELVFTGWEWQKTPEGQLFFAIRGAIAQYEREKIRQRMKRGKLQKARSGIEPNRVSIFGFEYDEQGQAVINHEEAEVIKKIYHWFTCHDLNPSAIARRLEESGIKAPGGGSKWYKQTVRYILANPTYTGKHIYNMRDDSGLKYNKYAHQKKKRKLKQREEWIEIPFPQIIASNIYTAAQEKLQRSKRLWSGKSRHVYLLSGILRCGYCGKTMTGMLTNYRKAGPSNTAYTCRRARGTGCCQPYRYIKATKLEEEVWQHVIGWITQPEEVFRHLQYFNVNESTLDEEETRLREELKTLKRGRENLLEVLASGIVAPDESTKKILGELTEKLQAVQRRILALQVEKEQQQKMKHSLRKPAAKCMNLHDYLYRFRTDDKRVVLRAFVEEVTVYGRGEQAEMIIQTRIPKPQAQPKFTTGV